MTNPTDHDIGKAYKAFTAYNYNAREKIKNFDLQRWVKVVKALNGSAHTITRKRKKKKSWTHAQRMQYRATIAARRSKANAP